MLLRELLARARACRPSEPLSTISQRRGRSLCAARLAARRGRFSASSRTGRDRPRTSACVRRRFSRAAGRAAPSARGRYSASQTSSIRIESSAYAVARSLPSAWPLTSRSTALAVDDLRVARVRAEQVVGDRAARLRAEPVVDRGVEEADLRLVDDPVRDEAARGVLEHVLRLEAPHLQRRPGSSRRARRAGGRGTARAPRASAPSTRGRSSGACRRRARAARRGRARPAAGRRARRRGAYEIARSAALPSRSASGPRTSSRRSPASSAAAHREQPLGRIRRPRASRPAGAGARGRATPPRAWPCATAPGIALPACRRARPRGASGSRRAARPRPGRRARRSRAARRARDSARKPSDGEIGERLVEVPDELGEVDRLLARTRARARGGRCRACSATKPRVGELVALAGLARTRPRTSCTGSLMCRAISATIRLESSPPLSIAPSGTSLISRSRTDSSSFASSRSLRSSSAAAALERRAAGSSSTRSLDARRSRSTSSAARHRAS